MKTLPIMLLILASSLLSTKTASAQNKPLACQDVASGGLNWENGRWVILAFKPDKFILVLEGNTLTKESVGKALRVDVVPFLRITCSADDSLISCNWFSFYFVD